MRLFRHIFVKKILFPLSLCGISLLVLMLVAQRESVTPVETETSALPLTGITILVDAGHGGYDGGSRAKDSLIWEKEINLAVALETKKALEAQGATVLMTRETDVDLCDDNLKGIQKKRQDLKRRLDIAKEGNADFVLSIHMNEYRSRSESGPHVFYRKGQDESRLLAGCMQKALITELNPKRERVAQAGDYYILSLDKPSVLIECGFISNAAEEKALLSKDYQGRIAQAVCHGLMDYLQLML